MEIKRTVIIRIILISLAGFACVLSRLYLDSKFEEFIPQDGFEAGFIDSLFIDAARTVREEYRAEEGGKDE